MFLTRFQINPHRRDATKLLASPQVMHAAVLAAFPGMSANETGRVLWRIDESENARWLIIASPMKPDLTHLVEQAGWPSLEPGWETRDYAPLLQSFGEGQRWAFRLRANPTYARSPEPGERRGRVVAHRTVAHQLGWLERQAGRHGFSLVMQQVDRLSVKSGEPVSELVPTTKVIRSELLRFARGTHTVTLRTAMFDGLLEVSDADAFRSALTHGIGPARAYGCGLLTVAPFRSMDPASDIPQSA